MKKKMVKLIFFLSVQCKHVWIAAADDVQSDAEEKGVDDQDCVQACFALQPHQQQCLLRSPPAEIASFYLHCPRALTLQLKC